jgi:hypothetical protein
VKLLYGRLANCVQKSFRIGTPFHVNLVARDAKDIPLPFKRETAIFENTVIDF